MKVLSIIGARPQFVKLAPFSHEVRKHFDEVIVHTGQHYDVNMSDAFFRDLEIPAPDHHLGVGSGTHGQQTGDMLSALEEVIGTEAPAWVVVFGDTNTTLAGAVAAAKMQVPVVHIEAGLRSHNRKMPEEINRILTDHASDYLFAPTQVAMGHLSREGLAGKGFLTGDIMVDALGYAVQSLDRRPAVPSGWGTTNEPYYLLTLHRPYNVDNPQKLGLLLASLGSLGVLIIFPVHPRTRKILRQHQIQVPESISLIDPQGYLDFVKLERHAEKIITDSGGVQKEAFILRKPCITVRPETEWVETVEAGWNLLADASHPSFPEQVAAFSPNGVQPCIFGEDVARKMTRLLIDGCG